MASVRRHYDVMCLLGTCHPSVSGVTLFTFLQVINVDKNLVQESLGKGSAISPILTIEPFRRKFHKPIELLLPIPGHGDYKVDANKLKILFSLSPSEYIIHIQ